MAERVEKGDWGFSPEDGIDGRCLLTQDACVRLQQPVAAAALGVFLPPPCPNAVERHVVRTETRIS